MIPVTAQQVPHLLGELLSQLAAAHAGWHQPGTAGRVGSIVVCLVLFGVAVAVAFRVDHHSSDTSHHPDPRRPASIEQRKPS